VRTAAAIAGSERDAVVRLLHHALAAGLERRRGDQRTCRLDVAREGARGLLRRRLLRGLLHRGLLRRRLLGRRLLRGDLPGGRLLRCGLLRAEAAPRRLAGFLEQAGRLLQGQAGRVAVLGDLAVEAAVAQVRAETAIEHLDVAARELLDHPVARDLLLLLDQRHRAFEVDLVRVVVGLERCVGVAAPRERAEAADAHAHLHAVALAQHARQAEQLERL